MSLGNGFGFDFDKEASREEVFGYNYGSFVIEISGKLSEEEINNIFNSCSGDSMIELLSLGKITDNDFFSLGDEKVSLSALSEKYENKLEKVFPCNIPSENTDIPVFTYEAENVKSCSIKASKPRVLIPVFPGTNCEYDTAKRFEKAGAETKVFVINNLSKENLSRSIEDFARSVDDSQILFLPGGFSGGDEPDGSGKFIISFMRNPEIKAAVTRLLDEREGLMGGICNGFQALIKLGLLPFGKIIDTDENCPTLTYNTISRHQSKLVRTRLCSDNSPWLKYACVGETYTVPISHGEGRLLADKDLLLSLLENGQILTQYVDENDMPTSDISYNTNNSIFAVEGLLSPDGRIFGKMGHSERIGEGLYKNVAGEYDMKLFESAVEYFK